MFTKPSVLFIRESEPPSTGILETLRGSPEGGRANDPLSFRARARMESMGPLYRTLRHRFGEEVTLEVVDSASPLSAVISVLRATTGHGLEPIEVARALARIPSCGIMLNGRLISQGEWPSPWEMVVRLEELLGAGRTPFSGGRVMGPRAPSQGLHSPGSASAVQV